MQQTKDALTVTRLYGEPIERDGVTVIPVAVVRGGGGGGGGHGEGPGPGERRDWVRAEVVGFWLAAKPAGMFVIEGDRVSWRPAIDVNRIVLGAQVVTIVALVVLRSVLRHR